jgi:hypothetical protein
MDPFTLGFVAFQVGVSLINQWQNSELTAQIKEEQRKAKLDEIRNSQRRDMERFKRNCQLQEEFEAQAHLDKIKKYKQDFLNSLIKMAHKENLDNHYRLNVSPYVIQRSLIPTTEEDLNNTRQEIFCILTGSNNEIFNKQVLPYIDESICDLISRFWNESSNHTICYYQNLWDSEANLFSNEDIENMKSLINTPTVSISPLFLNRKEGFQLVLKISAWGMGEQESISCEIETGVKFESLPNKYSLIEISEMINQITPQAICAIGQLADVFYWVNYYQPPLLPILLGKEKIKVSSTLASQYALGYSDFYKRLVIGNNNEIRKSYSLVADIAEINQYSHPERSLICLKSIMSLTDRYGATSEIIEHSMLSLFSARTDENPESLIKVDSSLLHRQDIDYILKLIEYAKTIDDSRLIKELSEIVKRYVSSWRYTIS